MKKKIILFILLILLVGCSKKEEEISITEFYPTYNEIDIKLGLMFNTLKATIGAYNNTHTEVSSYKAEEQATVYEYDTLEVETYFDNLVEKVYSINFTSPDQSTNEGLHLGDTKEKMLEVYKDDYENPIENVFIYNISNTNLSFTLENDIIVGIRYYLS